MFNELGIVVVLYNPEFSSVKYNFQRYYNDNMHIVFVINGIDATEKVALNNELKNNINTDVILLNENKGIAFAQNKGIGFVRKKYDINYILFLDQDSYLEKNELSKLLIGLKDYNLDRPALVGPNLSDDSFKFRKVSETISSGSIIPVEVLKKVGTFKSKYFIDFVDYEWCWRAIKYGYGIYIIGNVKIHHQTDDDIQRRFGHTMEKPFRLYYVYRNLIWSLRDSSLGFVFALKWYIRYFVKALFQITVAKNRYTRLKKILRGVHDGFIRN